MRVMKLGLCIGAAATALVAGLQTPASAANLQYFNITGGYAAWSPDPTSDGTPGDAIKACDTSADGWAIAVTMTHGSQDRYVDTRGHNSPYCTGWASGDLPEGDYVTIKVEQVKSDGSGGLLRRYTTYFQTQA